MGAGFNAISPSTYRIHPSNNDVASTAGHGSIASEEILTAFLNRIHGSANWVLSGFTYSSAAGLVATFAAGEAVIEGHHVVTTGTWDVTLVDDATNYVYLTWSETSDRAVALGVHVATSASPPSTPYAIIATVTTVSGSVTASTDERTTDTPHIARTETDASAYGFAIDEDNMASNSATKFPVQQSVKAYVDGLVADLPSALVYRGGYDASTNTPDPDTSPSGVSQGDVYVVTAAGTFFTAAVESGDLLIAEINSAAVEADWTIVQANLTAATIKTLYESNADTNAFTDAQESKLAGIAASAIANVVEDTTPQLGGSLDLNERSINPTVSPAVDHTTSGYQAAFTAGENLVFGDVCYIKSDGKAWKADADAAAPATHAWLIAVATIAADASGLFAMPGSFIRDDTWAWTVGGRIYLSATAGALTQTAPSPAIAMGVATHADRMIFHPDVSEKLKIRQLYMPFLMSDVAGTDTPPLDLQDTGVTYVVGSTSNTNTTYIPFQITIPNDFVSLTSLKIRYTRVGGSGAIAATEVNVSTRCVATGEAYTGGSTGSGDLTDNPTNNNLSSWNAGGAIGTMAAGDTLFARIKVYSAGSSGHTLWFFGATLEYVSNA